MAKTNHGRVGEALDLLNKGLKPYVEREFNAAYKDQWQDKVQQLIRDQRGISACKTTFLQMWKSKMEEPAEESDKLFVISLNAWESDYCRCSNPLMAGYRSKKLEEIF